MPGVSTIHKVRIATRDNMLKCFWLKAERVRRRIRKRPENQKETIYEGSSWLIECCLVLYHEIEDVPMFICCTVDQRPRILRSESLRMENVMKSCDVN